MSLKAPPAHTKCGQTHTPFIKEVDRPSSKSSGGMDIPPQWSHVAVGTDASPTLLNGRGTHCDQW